MNRSRVLLAGTWEWDIYEAALACGFEAHGWSVVPFCTTGIVGAAPGNSVLGRIRPAWSLGTVNSAFVHAVLQARPDIVFLWKCLDILPSSLRAVRKKAPKTLIVSYNNDNPFVSVRERIKCRHFLACLKEVDLAAVYRPSDRNAALTYGAAEVELWPPSYIRALHRPVSTVLKTDVIFAGHFEHDGRLAALRALHAAGVSVTVRGTGWGAIQSRYTWLAAQSIQRLAGEEYVTAIAEAKLSLAFLSGKNADVYTRRCFEIPACGSVLVAPRTPELTTFFREDEEAVFWGSTEELVDKVCGLLADEKRRASIAASGLKRVRCDGHNEYGRAAQIIGWLEKRRGI